MSNPAPLQNSVFTIVGGTTIPDRAAIIRESCREGSEVELRRDSSNTACIGVWLSCPVLKGLLTTWKRIGEVPAATADELHSQKDVSAILVAKGTVRTVYAPIGRDEAVVTVELRPPA